MLECLNGHDLAPLLSPDGRLFGVSSVNTQELENNRPAQLPHLEIILAQ